MTARGQVPVRLETGFFHINWKPIGKIHDNANTQNQALRARVALLLLRTTPVRSPGGSYSATNRKLPLSY